MPRWEFRNEYFTNIARVSRMNCAFYPSLCIAVFLSSYAVNAAGSNILSNFFLRLSSKSSLDDSKTVIRFHTIFFHNVLRGIAFDINKTGYKYYFLVEIHDIY